MHRTLAVTAFLLALPLASAEQNGVDVGFSLPAQLGDEITGTNLDWAFLIFEPTKVQGDLDFGHESSRVEIQEEGFVYEREFDGAYNTASLPTSSGPTAITGPAIVMSEQTSSIFVAGKNLTLHLRGAQLDVIDGQLVPSLGYITNPDLTKERSARFEALQPVGRTLLSAENSELMSLTAAGGMHIEEHGLSLHCQGCPSGPDREQQQFAESGLVLTKRTLRFHQFEITDGAFQLEGRLRAVAFGGAAPTLFIKGTARLPQVSGLDCPECLADDASLTLSGLFQLDTLVVAEGPRAHTTLSGDLQWARLDETSLSPETLLPVQAALAAAATLGFAAMVKFLLLPLFTRLSKKEALEHPKRSLIYAYIQEHPGANFREVARMTGIASGTVRHHLTVLERSGHIVEHPHQGTVRLFENHGKFDHTWSDLVLLREPTLARLHSWLKEHENAPQKLALEAMEREGWSRSTTQHRLARLVAGGLVTIRLQGRLKIYNVVERAAPKVIGLGPIGLDRIPARPGLA